MLRGFTGLVLFIALTLSGEGFRHFLDLKLFRSPFFEDFSPSEGLKSEVWVGISGSANSKTSSCFSLKGESEGRVSSMCWGWRRMGPIAVWFGKRYDLTVWKKNIPQVGPTSMKFVLLCLSRFAEGWEPIISTFISRWFYVEQRTSESLSIRLIADQQNLHVWWRYYTLRITNPCSWSLSLFVFLISPSWRCASKSCITQEQMASLIHWTCKPLWIRFDSKTLDTILNLVERLETYLDLGKPQWL